MPVLWWTILVTQMLVQPEILVVRSSVLRSPVCCRCCRCRPPSRHSSTRPPSSASPSPTSSYGSSPCTGTRPGRGMCPTASPSKVSVGGACLAAPCAWRACCSSLQIIYIASLFFYVASCSIFCSSGLCSDFSSFLSFVALFMLCLSVFWFYYRT